MRRKLVALVLVLGILALAAFTEWAFEVVPFKRHSVAMPPTAATAQQVVATYIEALDAHDCDTVDRLWLNDEDDPRMWCSEVARAHILGAAKAFHESDQRLDVALTLRVRWRLFKNDGSTASDPFPWSYILEQDHQGAWRIVGNGLG